MNGTLGSILGLEEPIVVVAIASRARSNEGPRRTEPTRLLTVPKVRAAQLKEAALGGWAEGRDIVAKLGAGSLTVPRGGKAKVARDAEAREARGGRGGQARARGKIASAVGGAPGHAQTEACVPALSNEAATKPALISHGAGEGVGPVTGVGAARNQSAHAPDAGRQNGAIRVGLALELADATLAVNRRRERIGRALERTTALAGIPARIELQRALAGDAGSSGRRAGAQSPARGAALADRRRAAGALSARGALIANRRKLEARGRDQQRQGRQRRARPKGHDTSLEDGPGSASSGGGPLWGDIPLSPARGLGATP